MALHALHSLGANAQRMRDFYASYSRRFEGQPVPVAAAVEKPQTMDWQALRGRADAYPLLLAYFNNLVTREGLHTSLHLVLPDLMPGVAAAAFHGAIRTAHAVQANHANELAAALAYWAWRWQTLDTPPAPATLLGLNAWAPRLVHESLGWRCSGQRISIRMADASRSMAYADLATALVPAANLATRIRELAQLAAERYVASPNFTVLHMVTGLRALRTLLPWLDDSERAQTLLSQNFAAAYMAAQVKPLGTPPRTAPCNWDTVVAAAIASDDDHVIKLVHACREEAAVYGDGNYLQAATLVTRR